MDRRDGIRLLQDVCMLSASATGQHGETGSLGGTAELITPFNRDSRFLVVAVKLALIALFAAVEMHKTHLTLPEHINSLNLLCAN